jgi:hypothetical protein
MSDIVGEWYVEEEMLKCLSLLGLTRFYRTSANMMAMEEAQG